MSTGCPALAVDEIRVDAGERGDREGNAPGRSFTGSGLRWLLASGSPHLPSETIKRYTPRSMRPRHNSPREPASSITQLPRIDA